MAGYTAASERVEKVALLAPYNQATDINILETPLVGEYFNNVFQVPLLIWGKNDPTVPYNKDLALMLNPQLLLLDNCVHIPQIEYLEEVNREPVAFLATPLLSQAH